jgi:hypothetical protein
MGMGIAVKFKSLFGGEIELKKQNVSLSYLIKFIGSLILFLRSRLVAARFSRAVIVTFTTS